MANQVLTPGQMTDPNMVLAFMFAGDATLTFRSVKAGNRYTFRIQEGEKKEGEKAPFFVKLLIGSDNENDYAYMGMITFYQGKWNFRLTKASAKANLTEDSLTVKAFRWTFQPLLEGRMPIGVEIWHEGRCARCNRKLTDPTSISQGFGPDCLEMSGGLAGLMKLASSFITPRDPQASAVKVSSSQISDTSNMITVVDKGVLTSAGREMARLKPKPLTPAAIVAAVNEDAEIAKLANEMWAKNEANPINQPVVAQAVPLPVEQKAAVALARSQGWTVDEAVDALSRRRIVNLNLSSHDTLDRAAATELHAAVGINPDMQDFSGEQHLDDVFVMEVR